MTSTRHFLYNYIYATVTVLLKLRSHYALPEVSSVIHPDRRHGKIFLLEAFVTLESEAAAEKKKSFQSVSTCSEVDATQFDTTYTRRAHIAPTRAHAERSAPAPPIVKATAHRGRATCGLCSTGRRGMLARWLAERQPGWQAWRYSATCVAIRWLEHHSRAIVGGSS